MQGSDSALPQGNKSLKKIEVTGRCLSLPGQGG